MKKLLCLFLVAVLVLCFIPAVAAEEGRVTDDDGITSIPLFNCDVKPGGSNSLSLDTNEKTEGEASLTFAVSRGVVNEMVLSYPVDGYGFDTLEFDLYVSDVSLFNYFGVQGQMDSNLELSSSGRNDQQEIAWTLASIKSNNMGEEIVAGWNHIILPFDTAIETDEGGEFDVSHINFMRFYMVGETVDTGITVKIDNFRLSDYNEVITAIRKEKADREAADKVKQKIEALEEITAENYETAKKSVEEARKAYKRLNDDAKSYVSKTLLVKLETAEAKIAEYEANPPSNEPADDPIDDPIDEPTDDPVDEPTDDPVEEEQPKDEQPPVEEPKKSGCGASIALSALIAMIVAAGFGVSALKKEN